MSGTAQNLLERLQTTFPQNRRYPLSLILTPHTFARADTEPVETAETVTSRGDIYTAKPYEIEQLLYHLSPQGWAFVLPIIAVATLQDKWSDGWTIYDVLFSQIDINHDYSEERFQPHGHLIDMKHFLNEEQTSLLVEFLQHPKLLAVCHRAADKRALNRFATLLENE